MTALRKPPCQSVATGAPAANAAFVVDRALRVLVANPAGYELAASGGCVSLAMNRLRLRDTALNTRLELCLQAMGATTGAGREARLSLTAGGRTRMICVSSLAGATPPDDGFSAHALILIKEPTADMRLNQQAVAEAFGLTPAEQRLLGLVCEGHNVIGAAQRLGVAPTTARTQLQSIFSKTDTNRQSDLVRLVTTFVAKPH